MSNSSILNNTVKGLKKELRRKGYTYLNKHLTTEVIKNIFSTHIYSDGKVIFDVNKLDVSETTKSNLFKRFTNKKELYNCGGSNFSFNEYTSKIVIEHFNSIPGKIKTSNVFTLREQEEDEGETTNLFTIDEFNGKNRNKTRYNIDEKDYTFVPNKYLELSNIHTLINKYGKFRLSLNTSLAVGKDKDFNFNSIDNVKKFKINIKRKIYSDGHVDKLVSEFTYTCPRCFQKILLLPNQTYRTIKHGCDGYVSEKGVQKYQIIQPDNKASSTSKELTLYEFTIDHDKNIRHAFSFNPNINPGKYEADILLTCDSLNGNTKKNLAIIMGIEREDFEIIDNLVDSTEAKQWCIKKELPYIRFLDTLFSIRKLHRTYTGHNIDDKGMLNQIFVTLSGLGKSLFHHRAIGVSVMGNKSLSKTYSSHMFAMPLDRDFVYVQNSTDVTVPGLKGGINNKKDINGTMTTVFEPGLFTRGGLTVFDEGDKYYSDDMLNTSLKDLFNNTISIFKIGGLQGIKQNYTPIICSNFKFNHIEYSNHVKNVYSLIIRDKNAITSHNKTDREVIRYLSEIDLYLPLSYYVDFEKNEHLAKAISYVRSSSARKDKDWKTGGSLPSSYRLLFDVVCNNKEKKFEDVGERVCKRTEIILPELYDIPYEEFLVALKEYYEIHNIDLYKLTNNNSEVNDRLSKLFKSIDEFLVNDGKDIHIHLSDNSRKIDEKLLNIVSTVISIMQLLEDPNSITLSDNVKEWAKIILLKCKRGITEEEYDFKTHKKYRFVRFDISDTIGDISAMKQDKHYSNIVNKMAEMSSTNTEDKGLFVEDD